MSFKLIKNLTVFLFLATTSYLPIGYAEASFLNHVQHVSQEQQAKNTVHDFFIWYTTYYQTLSQYRLIITQIDGHYTVNWPELNKFLNAWVQNPYVSKHFHENIRAYFERIDRNLKISTEKEGPVLDLDYDLFFCSQEYDVNHTFVSHLTYKIIKKNQRKLKIQVTTPYGSSIPIELETDQYSLKISKICRIGF